MTFTTVQSQLSPTDIENISGCYQCPAARHLHGDRYACVHGIRGVTLGTYGATAECHQAIADFPSKYYEPLPLPDLKGLDPQLVCDYIHLEADVLDDLFDDHLDGYISPDGENAVEITHEGIRIGYLKREGDFYYCDRIKGKYSVDPYWIALHMVHPDFLYEIAEEIIAKQEPIPEYC